MCRSGEPRHRGHQDAEVQTGTLEFTHGARIAPAGRPVKDSPLRITGALEAEAKRELH